jgi:hypothetical protein
MKYKDVRKRSAAYPFEIPYRLINMFSVKGDTVVDPFLGTGTTMITAVAAGRNCLGFEIEPDFRKPILSGMAAAAESGDGFKYTNKHYGFPVVTNQETELLFELPESITETGADIFKVCYFDKPWKENVTDRQGFTGSQFSSSLNDNKLEAKPKPKKQIQLRLLD